MRFVIAVHFSELDFGISDPNTKTDHREYENAMSMHHDGIYISDFSRFLIGILY